MTNRLIEMSVNLINYSKFTDKISNMSNLPLLDQIAYIARVSNPDNQTNFSTSEKLCKYLLKHKHFSPFEMVNICLEINTTRDIGRQILRHRSFSFQEFSQRYAVPTLGTQIRETRLQDCKNRQNSLLNNDVSLQNEWDKKQDEIIKLTNSSYEWAIKNGIAKEQARSVLPEGNTMSRLYMNGTLRSWIHYIQTRCDPSTQKEHREIAMKCAEVINTIFPIQLFDESKI